MEAELIAVATSAGPAGLIVFFSLRMILNFLKPARDAWVDSMERRDV